MPTVATSSAELYYEVRGSGPPVLFIMGATGDAVHFTGVADDLADGFTVLTYDRRGMSRSPRPPGWSATSVEEQAGDAAALLHALDVSPAAVFGTSIGGVFALGLLIHHPEAVRGAILHEPMLPAALRRPEEVGAAIGTVIQEGVAAGGPSGGLERFWRFVAGDANWEGLESSLRERMLGNAATYLGLERGAFDAYRPDDATLAAISAPVQVLVSDDSLPFFAEMAGWLGQRLGVEASYTPGTHTPYLDHPRELARSIRPFLTRVSGPAAGARA